MLILMAAQLRHVLRRRNRWIPQAHFQNRGRTIARSPFPWKVGKVVYGPDRLSLGKEAVEVDRM
jgi:hypothetical protein